MKREGDFVTEIVEDIWDCTQCGKKGILGREMKCPSCGDQKDDSEQYKTGNQEEVTDPELLKLANAGPNWKCAFCEKDNRANHDHCQVEGGPKEVFKTPEERKQEQERLEKEKEEQILNFKLPPIDTGRNRKGFTDGSFPLAITGVIGAVIMILFMGMLMHACTPTYSMVTLSGASWRRAIHIERLAPVTEEAWEIAPPGSRIVRNWIVPDGGGYDERVVGHRTIQEPYTQQLLNGSETYYTDEKIDDGFETTFTTEKAEDGYGYNTKTRRVQTGTSKVLDHTEKLKNGFSKNFYKEVPIYKNEEYRERYTKYKTIQVPHRSKKYKIVKAPHQRPLYKDVTRYRNVDVPVRQRFPIPRVRVAYEVDRWSDTGSPAVASGNDLNPTWPNPALGPNERTAQREESYNMHLRGEDKEYDYTPRADEFSRFKIGARYKAKISLGSISSLTEQ